MVIKIKKSYVIVFISIVLILLVGGLFFVNRDRLNFSKNFENKSGFYKEVSSSNEKVKSDEELESTAFSVMEKLSLDLGEPIEATNVKSPYGDSYNYDLIFSNGAVQLDEVTGELISIAVDSTIEQSENNLTEEELIKKASEYYNILDCPSSYEITVKENLGENYYNVVWEKKYEENLFSKYESVNMVLNKADGSLTKVTINNVPNTTDKAKGSLEKAEAEKTAKSFKELKGYNYSGQLEKKVVVPNTTYITNNYETADFSKTAWVAEFKNDLGEEAYLYIDATDGEILGGDFN